MVGCAAPGCKSGCDGKLPVGVTCHLLPKDKDIRKKWIQAIPREDWTPSASARICSLHFEEEDFVKERTDSNPNRQRGELQRRRIRPNVVPHIFPNCPFYLSKKQLRERSQESSSDFRHQRMFDSLNADQGCILARCRWRKKDCAKSPMRPQDFEALGLKFTPNQFICPMHFTHDDPYLANQVFFFSNHGFLAEGARLRKTYSVSRILKKVQEQYHPNSLLIGLTLTIPQDSIQDDLPFVGPMLPLNIQAEDSVDQPMGIPWEHDYCGPLIEKGLGMESNCTVEVDPLLLNSDSFSEGLSNWEITPLIDEDSYKPTTPKQLHSKITPSLTSSQAAFPLNRILRKSEGSKQGSKKKLRTMTTVHIRKDLILHPTQQQLGQVLTLSNCQPQPNQVDSFSSKHQQRQSSQPKSQKEISPPPQQVPHQFPPQSSIQQRSQHQSQKGISPPPHNHVIVSMCLKEQQQPKQLSLTCQKQQQQQQSLYLITSDVKKCEPGLPLNELVEHNYSIMMDLEPDPDHIQLPPLTHEELIYLAILHSPTRFVTENELIEFAKGTFPVYKRKEASGWDDKLVKSLKNPEFFFQKLTRDGKSWHGLVTNRVANMRSCLKAKSPALVKPFLKKGLTWRSVLEGVPSIGTQHKITSQKQNLEQGPSKPDDVQDQNANFSSGKSSVSESNKPVTSQVKILEEEEAREERRKRFIKFLHTPFEEQDSFN